MTSSGSHEAAGAADVGDGGTGHIGDSGKAHWVRRMMREPLLQFMLIGSVIFAAHAAATPSVSKDRLIEVTPEVRQSIIDAFKSAHEGREPGQDELAKLTDLWLLNEITFREALAQGLDKGDEMIRDRIVHKMPPHLQRYPGGGADAAAACRMVREAPRQL
jgi:hypothetical protein